MRYAAPILTTLALLLTSAHALRGGDHGLAASFALLAGLVAARPGWLRPVAAAALVGAGWMWADTAVHLVRFRLALDLPWAGLAAILAGVLAVHGLALLALSGQSGTAFFRRDQEQALPRAGAFLLAVGALAVARAASPFPVLLADRYFPGWGWTEILFLGLYAQWVLGRVLPPAGHARVRPRIWLFFSAVFFLQLGLGLSGMDAMLMTGRLHLPVPALIVAGPVFRGGGWFMPILFGVTVLLVGPAWCSHLCYIGAWDDVLSRTRRIAAPDARLRRLSVLGRGATLVLCVGGALLLRVLGAPAGMAVFAAAVFGLAGVAVMLLASRRRGIMVHCTAFCPMGLVAGVLGRLSPWRIRIDAGCTRCGACLARCRSNALDADRLALGRPAPACTLCGDCVSACGHGRIGYRFPGLDNDAARTLFLVLVAGLHAVFLGVARI